MAEKFAAVAQSSAQTEQQRQRYDEAEKKPLRQPRNSTSVPTLDPFRKQEKYTTGQFTLAKEVQGSLRMAEKFLSKQFEAITPAVLSKGSTAEFKKIKLEREAKSEQNFDPAVATRIQKMKNSGEIKMQKVNELISSIKSGKKSSSENAKLGDIFANQQQYNEPPKQVFSAPKPTLSELSRLETQIEASQEITLDTGISDATQGITHQSGTIRVESFGDDKFYDFFKETVAIDKDDQSKILQKKQKKTKIRNYFNTGSINTGDITVDSIKDRFRAKPENRKDEAPFEQEAEKLVIDDYNSLSDASSVVNDLRKMTSVALVRLVTVALFCFIGIYITVAPMLSLPSAELFSAAGASKAYLTFFTVLLVLASLICYPTVLKGANGIIGPPSQDSLVLLSIVAALSQLIACFVFSKSTDIIGITVFALFALITLFANLLGRYIQIGGITSNFEIASAGFDHSAAYLIDNYEVVNKLSSGLDEPEPELMLSRPTALVKGFIKQSFSKRASDFIAKKLFFLVFIVSLLCGALTMVLHSGNILLAITTFAAVATISAPLATSLVAAIPTDLMNKSAARIGAVITGWKAIETIGRTNIVMVNARDIFPPSTVKLHGIKTFEKERIDHAIIYAASILIKGSDTLKDIFLGVIEGKAEMLLDVENLNSEIGYGFTGWIEGKRIIVGSREMMERYKIEIPSVEYEEKFTKGTRSPIYLSVSGKLFCMFVVGYYADEEIFDTIDVMYRSGLSILVKSEDFNITSELITQRFKLPKENIKVLNSKEVDVVSRLTSYMPESEGVMTHVGSFTSFVGGMRAAAAAASAEKMSVYIEIATVAIGLIISILLSITSGIHSLPLMGIVLYQMAWLAITVASSLLKRYS